MILVPQLSIIDLRLPAPERFRIYFFCQSPAIMVVDQALNHQVAIVAIVTAFGQFHTALSQSSITLMGAAMSNKVIITSS